MPDPHPEPPPSTPLEKALLVGAFVAAAVLLTWELGGREFWIDEQITVGHIRTAEGVYDAFHPPGYYFLLRQWAGVFGSSDGALRAFSVPWALLALAMVWLIARRVLGPSVGVLAVWLCALSPFALLYLRMARYFACTMAAGLCVVYCLILARRYGRPLHYVGLGSSAAALLWFHYVPSALLPIGFLWVLSSVWRRGRERYRWAAAAAFPILAYSPQILRTVRGIGAVSEGSEGHAVTLRAIAIKIAFAVYSILVGETTDFWRLYVVIPAAVAGFVLVVAGAGGVWRSRNPERGPLLLAWPLALGLVVALLSTVAASEPWPRVSSLALFAAPFVYMLIARGTTALPRAAGVGLAIVFMGGQVYGVGNYLARRQFLNPGYNAPWREVNRRIQTHGQPGDLAVAVLDSTAARYWDGPVQFYEPLAEEPTLGAEVRADMRRTLEAGNSVWVIVRDRGSQVARDASQELIDGLAACTHVHETDTFQDRTPGEQRWRSRIQGYPSDQAYLSVRRFRDPRPDALEAWAETPTSPHAHP